MTFSLFFKINFLPVEFLKTSNSENWIFTVTLDTLRLSVVVSMLPDRLCGNRTRWPSRKRTPVYITIDRFLKRFIRPFHFFQYSCFSVSNSITSSNQGHSKIPKKSSTRIFSVAHKIRCEPMEFVARLQSNLRGETSEVLVNWIFKYFVKSVILPHFNHTDTFLLILFLLSIKDNFVSGFGALMEKNPLGTGIPGQLGKVDVNFSSIVQCGEPW